MKIVTLPKTGWRKRVVREFQGDSYVVRFDATVRRANPYVYGLVAVQTTSPNGAVVDVAYGLRSAIYDHPRIEVLVSGVVITETDDTSSIEPPVLREIVERCMTLLVRMVDERDEAAELERATALGQL